jgi:hypothetical protein
MVKLILWSKKDIILQKIQERLQTCQSYMAQPKLTRDKIIFGKPQHIPFKKEANCSFYIETKKHLNLYLFSEDISEQFHKRFFAFDYQTLYQLSIKKKYCLYENYAYGEQVKLHLDIDIKKVDIPKDTNRDQLLNDTVITAIKLMTDKLTSYNINNPKIIVLSASTDEKVSAHIIFVNIIFNDIKSIKYFIADIDAKIIMNKVIDPRIYKKGSFRLLWSCKFGKKNSLEFYKSFNYEHKNDEQLFMDCLIKNIPKDHKIVNYDVPKDIKFIKKPKVKQTNSILTKTELKENNVSIEMLQQFVNLLNIELADDYESWIQIGMCLYNCNNTKACFDIWNEWSKKSSNYDGQDICIYKWNTFESAGLGIGTLRHHAKRSNPEKYDEIVKSSKQTLAEPIFDTIKFESNYLLGREEKITDKASVTGTEISKWIEGKTKSLAIWSPYDTGKTDTIKQILEIYNPKRILFISYRQSLTNDFYGNFNKYGLLSYLDGHYKEDKIICQVESLFKLLTEYMFNKTKIIPSYDLVVIDEIESVLAHFRSTTIGEKQDVFNLFRGILRNSKKILALDGDFNNRSYEMLNYFEKPIILQNQVKKGDKKFIFTNDRNNIDERIDEAMKAGKNIVIVSQSATIATYYYNKYKDKYKSVLHCSKSDDILKKGLKNVLEFWKTFQLVCYSPTIEAGVNFDCEHFDQIFVVLCSMSTSPRGLLQMISRVRKIRTKDVYTYLNNMPFKEHANFYTYKEVKHYVSEMCGKYLAPKFILDKNTNKEVISYEFDLYSQILVYNETENLNKNSAYFVPYMIKMLTSKGHTYEYIDTKKTKSNFKKGSIVKDEIVDAKDIDDDTFNDLLSSQKNNTATREEKVQIEKHLYKKNWKVETIDKQFIEKYYGMTGTLQNLRIFSGKEIIEPCLTINAKETIDYDKTRKVEQLIMIKEVLAKLGFDKPDNNTLLDRPTFEIRINKVLTECKLFLQPEKSQPLFGYRKSKMAAASIQSFMGFINSIFNNWGLLIINSRKNHTINGKKTKVPYYSLLYFKDMDKFI